MLKWRMNTLKLGSLRRQMHVRIHALSHEILIIEHPAPN